MCENRQFTKNREIYVCQYHKKIYEREPKRCVSDGKVCKYLQNYSREMVELLLNSGYRS